MSRASAKCPIESMYSFTTSTAPAPSAIVSRPERHITSREGRLSAVDDDAPAAEDGEDELRGRRAGRAGQRRVGTGADVTLRRGAGRVDDGGDDGA